MLFIFDENFPPEFVRGFSIIEKADKRRKVQADIVTSSDFTGKTGFSDESLIEMANGKNAVIVTHDSDFKRIKHYKPLLIKHKVGYIYFSVKSEGDYHYWDIVTSFVNKWQDITSSVLKSKHPFAFEINKKGHLVSRPF
jgi:predicted nuclease of predicted toxin-antitoxin system